MITRLTGIVLVVLGLLAILLPAFAEVRLDREVKRFLLEVQTALQNYHVEEELYPGERLTGAALIDLLIQAGHLEAPPVNPWSRRAYRVPDDPVDHLSYETDELAETYTLIARRPRSGEVHHILDSTEHHSLE